MGKAIIKNIGWGACDKALELGLAFTIGVWAARYMGPADFGAIAVATMVVGVFQKLCSAGIQAALGREIAAHPEQESEWVAAALQVVRGSVLRWFPLALLTGFLLPSPYRWPVVFCSVAVFGASSEVWSCAFQVTLRKKKEILAGRASQIIYGGLRVGMIVLSLPTNLFAAAKAVYDNLQMVFLRLSYGPSPLPAPENVAHIASVSRRLMAAGLWRFAQTAIPPLVLGIMAAKEAGIYTAATKVFWVASLIPILWAQSLAPAILAGVGARKPVLAVFSYGVVVAAVGFFFSPHIVRGLYGAAFMDAAAPGRILLMALPAFGCIPLMEARMLTLGRDGQIIRNNTIGGILGLLVATAGGIWGGAAGCAWGLFVGVTLTFLLHCGSTDPCLVKHSQEW